MSRLARGQMWGLIVGPLIATAMVLSAPPEALAGTSGLTLGQIRSMLLVGKEDAAIAAEVDRRGLAAPLSRADLTLIRRDGAGPQLVRALERRLARPVLIVRANLPGSEVSANDQPAGITDQTGRLKLAGLEAGSYRIQVRARGYLTATKNVSLARGEEHTLEFELRAAPGQLRVAASVPELSVKVDGKEVRLGTDRMVEVIAGSREVEVSCPYCAPARTVVQVVGGEVTDVDLVPEIEPGAVDAMVVRMEADLGHGRIPRAIDTAKAVLAIQEDRMVAHEVLAIGHYLRDDRSAFPAAAVLAVQHGVVLQLPIRHRDTLMAGELRDSVLYISGGDLRGEARHPEPCAWGGWLIPLAKLQRAGVVDDDGNVWLVLEYVDERGKAAKVRIADRGAVFVPAQRNKSTLGGLLNLTFSGFVMQKRSETYQSLDMLEEMIEALAGRD
jgi:hypothetical protein